MSIASGLYQTAGSLARPVLRRMLRRRLAAGKEIPDRIGERYGIATLPRPAGRLIWFHAASVGETMSVLPVIASLDGCEVLLTTGTATSAKLAAARLPAHARHQFVPLDVPAWVAAFLDHWQPDCAVFTENELWPSLLRQADARGIPRMLINASMSARSARHWRLLPGFAENLVFGFRWIHVQSAADAANFLALGAAGILDWGNLKFAAPALPVDEAALGAIRAAIPGPLWLAASTHSGEEQIVIAAHQQLISTFPTLVTIIVPRHPERGGEFLDHPRRSLGEPPLPGGIYIADTLGELGLFYRLAPFAFIGGSLVNIGGHNLAEAARLGIPVIIGPHAQEITAQFALYQAAGAIRTVANAADLAEAARCWLQNPAAAKNAGIAAQAGFAGFDALPARLAALILETTL